jgi:alkanesulfonate monooxygenase SsuD/methylene tetrahydromethanopterin reductase-like flavin-dependent oxidoreductase (luciferase family)
MQFGYFTLSDNGYRNNARSPNDLVSEIIDQAIYAEQIGLNSVWIGEHHFGGLGVLSCPDLALAYIAARTKRIRLAPAVTVLPMHHPIRIAEQWASLDLMSGGRVDFAAGRGYDRREYQPLGANFDENQSVFEEGMEIVRRLWNADGPISHRGRHYRFDDVLVTPQPVQRPLPAYVGAFSRPSIELAARLGCGLAVAPFAAALTFGGLRQVTDFYADACRKHGTQPGRRICSYFIHFADDAAAETAARARQIRYFRECVIDAFPSDPATMPPSYRYFIEIVERLSNVRPEGLTENSVLIGPPSHITEVLKKVEAAGIDEVILYFNVGLKPHAQVKDDMDRFMTEIAPSFVEY